MKSIVLAGGCFWGVEAYFSQLKGVLDTSVGYVDGNMRNPSYDQVCHGEAKHTEACQVFYDENVISLEQILDHFFRIINPFSINKQGHDIGRQYRSGIYLDDMSQEERIKSYMMTYFGADFPKVATKIHENKDYDLAEAYHQDYLKKNPGGYCHVNLGLATKEEVKS
ncbi:MAG: peptide-methionine (S)-S-oxide reductase [Tenericutes bacterium HGW-Tenericutes-3]|nr:MAG: peptide-methionine (S)-S-oxide reductase [Tenericutes bacterium HGW-Tenericutes-3]